METILSYELADQEPSLEYREIDSDKLPMCFLGYIINNKYDESRLSLPKNVNASRFIFNTINKKYFLYGLINKPLRNNNFINNLQLSPPNSLKDYYSFLNKNNYSCYDCFLHFSPGVYPLDLQYKEDFFKNLNFSELLSKNKNVASFQQLGSIYLLALINLA